MREAGSYRGARRNAVLRPEEGPPGVWEGAKAKYQDPPPVRPNLSRRWFKDA